MANKRPHRFKVNIKSMIISISLYIIVFLITFILMYCADNYEGSAIPVNANAENSTLYQSNDSIKILFFTLSKSTLLYAAKDFFVILCSILGTNLVLNLIIQKISQNNLYDEFIIELLQNKNFLGSIPEDKRKIIFKNIEEMDFLGENKIYTELINNVREKIVKSHYPFYFISYNIDIICTLKPDCIEKEIIKTVEICSFEKSKKIKHYRISKFTLEDFNEDKPVVIKNIKIDGESKNVDDWVNYTSCDNKDNVYLSNVNYNTKVLCCLKKEIELKNDEPTKIEIKYITRVPLSDRVYISRLSAPCKKFHFHFRIDDSIKNYKIHAQAFGFQDDAMKNPAGSRKNEITYDIGDWAFPTDGVFVTFYE